MGVEEHKKHAHGPVTCAVITVSTTRTKKDDISGRTIIGILESAEHIVLFYDLIKDDVSLISSKLGHALENEGVQAVIINGGTGVGQKDVTIEAVSPYIEKELVGFGEIFRNLSYVEIGSAAILSRAIAGACKGKMIFCLPGSTNACKLAMNKLIVPELAHIIYELNR